MPHAQLSGPDPGLITVHVEIEWLPEGRGACANGTWFMLGVLEYVSGRLSSTC